MSDLNFFIIGAGGHARVLARVATLLNKNPICILENENSTDPLGEDEILEKDFLSLHPSTFMNVICGVGSTGKQTLREKILNRFSKFESYFTSLVHPQAYVDATAKIGQGSFIAQGVQIVRGCELKEHTLINTGVILDHDCKLSRGTSIGPGSVLSGEVRCGEFVHIGAGATVNQGIQIAERTVIGSGALVIESIKEPGGTWVGAPARRIK